MQGKVLYFPGIANLSKSYMGYVIFMLGKKRDLFT